MSEEEMNQELSTDELKDVSGGAQMGELRSDHLGVFKGNNLADRAKWANRLTTDSVVDKFGKKDRYTDKGATCDDD